MKRFSVCKSAILLALAAGLTGCGQYGDLYLPAPAPAEKPATAPADSPQADDARREQEQQDP